MFGNVHIQSDWAAVLAFLFGVAVIIPSVISALLAVIAVAGMLI